MAGKLPATALSLCLVPGLLLGLPGPLDEGPVDGDGLAEDVAAVQLLLGGQSLLVRLVLYQSVPLNIV